jgi:hypothetical protein
MSNLFIIGNGFDLAHGLKTKYSDFRDFLVIMEKEECKEVGEISISDDNSLLEDESIKYHFNNTVIPAMTNTLSQTLDFAQQKDDSSGKTPIEQMEEIEQFLNEADKIIQWIKHGSGQYYISEKDESHAIKQFIKMLEPQTGVISHNTNTNTTYAYWQTIENAFGAPAVRFLKSGDGSSDTPLWLTLRLFIKMMDSVEGENWTDFETSLGSNNFEVIFNLFNEIESDDIYSMCVSNFFTGLYYNTSMLFHAWIIYTNIIFEESAVSTNTISNLRSHIKMNQNNLELSLKYKIAPIINEENYINLKTLTKKHPMAKKQLINIFDAAKHNYFLTFNYTQTLEHIYNIPANHICHIHGISKSSNSTNDLVAGELIFGHGLSSIPSNVVNVVNTAFNITKKPVNQCISNNQLFFDNIINVCNIYSYGFSFGEVDMPYIEKILKCIQNSDDVTWYLNDFGSQEDRITYQDIIRKAGFKGDFDIFNGG